MRVVAITAVQLIMVSLLLTSREIVGSGARFRALGGRNIFVMSDTATVTVYCIADICMCAIIVLLRRRNLVSVVISVVFTTLGLLLGLLLFPVSYRTFRGGYGQLEQFFPQYLSTVAGWLIGRLVTNRLQQREDGLIKPHLQFSLGEIYIVIFVVAICSTLLSLWLGMRGLRY